MKIYKTIRHIYHDYSWWVDDLGNMTEYYVGEPFVGHLHINERDINFPVKWELEYKIRWEEVYSCTFHWYIYKLGQDFYNESHEEVYNYIFFSKNKINFLNWKIISPELIKDNFFEIKWKDLKEYIWVKKLNELKFT